MNITLWVLQVLLAVIFFAHGWLLLAPPATMLDLMNASMTSAGRIFIGASEVLAAIGLTVPGITRVQPWLISAAAAGLTIVMVGATIFHIVRGELTSAVITTVLLAATVFVAYMRWKVMPILARTLA